MTPPYPRYRDSGDEWTGDLPAHWGTTPLRRLASYWTSSVDKKSNADEMPVRLCNYTDVYYGERIRADEGEFMAATATAHEVARFGLERGDVLIIKDSEDWRDIGVPALIAGTSDDFVCGYHLGIVRSGDSLDAGYLFRAMQSDGVNTQLQVAATGVTRYGIPNGSVEGAVLPHPPLSEQRAIAAYLDRETARVDQLISMQESLIERLDEYRAALITQTVTCGLPPEAAVAAGLDPTPPLKDPGVAWLGKVPQHWCVSRLRRVASINDDKLTDDEDPSRQIDYVDIGSVQPGLGIVETESLIFDNAPSRARRLVQHGDTIVSTVRTYLRAIAPVLHPPSTLVVSTGFAVLRPRAVDPGYFHWAISENGFVSEIVARSNGVSYPAINAPEIGLLPIAVPPRREQIAICEFLNMRTARIDALRAKAETSIERLAEYRSALISAAVTGKIDVRDAAPVGSGDGA